MFDLRRALLAKEERESAGLIDFEFRLRTRTLRVLAARIGRDPDLLARSAARGNDAAIVGWLQAELPGTDVAGLFAEALRSAREQITSEFGDPEPHRLA